MAKYLSLKSLIVLALFVSILATTPVYISAQGVILKVTQASSNDYKTERKIYKNEIKVAKRDLRKESRNAKKEMSAKLKNANSNSLKKQIRKEYISRIAQAKNTYEQMTKIAKEKFVL